MAEPWLKYRKQTAQKPWERYAAQGKSFAPTAPEQPAKSPIEDVAKAVGSGLLQGAAGLIQFPADAGGYLADKTLSALKVPQASQELRDKFLDAPGTPSWASKKLHGWLDNIYTPQTTAGEYAQTGGQFVASLPVGGPANMTAKVLGTAAGAVGSETAGQLTKGTSLEPYARMVGAVVGGLSPAAARRVITPLPVSPARQSAIATLSREGVPVSAGQASGSKTISFLESEIGGAKMADLLDTQGEAFTRAALSKAGVQASRATPDTIDSAFKAVGRRFDQIAARNSLAPDVRIAQDTARAARDYAAMVPRSAHAPAVSQMGNDLLNAAQRGLPGKNYQAFASRLGKMARGTTDPQLKEVLSRYKSALDDSFERGLQTANSADSGALAEARRNYKNLLTLEHAATGAGEDIANGLISPQRLRASTVATQGRSSYARGRSELSDLAHAGQTVMAKLPNSGTAARTSVRNIGTGSSAVLGALLGQHAGGGLESMLAGSAAGYMAPAALGRAVMSKPVQSYLKNQLLARVQGSPVKEDILRALLGAQLHPKIEGARQ